MNAVRAGAIVPDWSARGVGALITTRRGGVSAAPFDSLNLQAGGGDDPEAVAANRAAFAEACGAAPVYLRQVHGNHVVRLRPADAAADAPLHDADGSFTTEPGVACTVQVADCLPVLFAAPEGAAVGAAHAGWRGLAAGVLEATLEALCGAADCAPGDIVAWLGPCIGPTRFEVGDDVVAAFGGAGDPRGLAVDAAAMRVNARASASPGAAAPRFIATDPGKWLADLPGLAKDRLRAAGVGAVGGGRWCTVSDPSRFFSFRRDRRTGRMAAAVWIERR